MIEGTRDAEHAAVDELLPWYVNGTLDPGELAAVRRHLQDCESCRESASLLSQVNAVINRPTATPITPTRRPDTLLAKIDRPGPELSRRPIRPMLAAAASLVVAAAAFWLWAGQEDRVPRPQTYEAVTSGSQRATMDYLMTVVFEAGVGAQDRQRVLREIGASDVRADESGSAWQVSVTLDAASLDELARFTTAMEARPEVKSARVVALQLPVQRKSGQEDR
jgi:hypothetical protein